MDISPKDASKLKILDPACGSGSFLIGAYQYLLDWHLQRYLAMDPAKLATGKTRCCGPVRSRSQHPLRQQPSIEINAITDIQRRNRIPSMLPLKSDILPLNDVLFHRAQQLQQFGIKPADALHVAAAESHRADIFLTCDDRLIKAARRNKRLLGIRVDNPVTWMETYEQR